VSRNAVGISVGGLAADVVVPTDVGDICQRHCWAFVWVAVIIVLLSLVLQVQLEPWVLAVGKVEVSADKARAAITDIAGMFVDKSWHLHLVSCWTCSWRRCQGTCWRCCWGTAQVAADCQLCWVCIGTVIGVVELAAVDPLSGLPSDQPLDFMGLTIDDIGALEH